MKYDTKIIVVTKEITNPIVSILSYISIYNIIVSFITFMSKTVNTN